MAQFFQGGGVVSDQGQQLRDAAMQIATLAQQKRQLDQQQQQNDLKRLNDLRTQFAVNAESAGMTPQEYAMSAGKSEWEAYTRELMRLSGQGGTPFRSFFGMGPTDEAVSAQAGQFTDVDNLSTETAMRSKLRTGALRGIYPGARQPTAPQKNAPQNAGTTPANAPQTGGEATVGPAPAPAPSPGLRVQPDQELVPSRLGGMIPQQVFRVISADNKIVGTYPTKEAAEQAIQPEIPAQDISELQRAARVSMPGAVKSETPPQRTPSFREEVLAKGVQGVSGEGSPEKDANLIAARPNEYAAYLKKYNLPDPRKQEAVDKKAEEATKALQDVASREGARAERGLGPSAGNKFYHKVANSKIRNWSKALVEASDAEIQDLVDEQMSFIENASSTQLEAYGLTNISNKKQKQEMLEAERDLLTYQLAFKSSEEQGRIGKEIAEQVNNAQKNYTDAWETVRKAAADAKQTDLAKFLVANKGYADLIQKAEKNYSEISGLPLKTLRVAGSSGFFGGLMSPPRFEEGNFYYPGLSGDAGQPGGTPQPDPARMQRARAILGQ